MNEQTNVCALKFISTDKKITKLIYLCYIQGLWTSTQSRSTKEILWNRIKNYIWHHTFLCVARFVLHESNKFISGFCALHQIPRHKIGRTKYQFWSCLWSRVVMRVVNNVTCLQGWRLLGFIIHKTETDIFRPNNLKSQTKSPWPISTNFPINHV